MIFIREIELEYTISGFVSPDSEDNHNVYINSKISDDRKKETLEHELEHIKKGHCKSDKPVVVCEDEIVFD